MRTNVLGVGFDNITLDEALAAAQNLIKERSGAYMVTPNPEIVMLCRNNPELTGVIDGAALVLPDGIGIMYGAKILGTPLKQRIPGIDFISALMPRLAAGEFNRVFLLGSKPGVAEKAAAKLISLYPGIEMVGTNDGYFTDDETVVEKINAAEPDLLLVCLGAPKQELWMQKNAPALNAALIAGLGGALDVFAGEVKRAPSGMRRLGLEWLYRLIKEPWRAKRMIKLPIFIFYAIGERIRGKKDAR